MSLHTKYAKQLAHHPFGHALYHPKTSGEIRPGLCGYFDHHGHWQPIVDLTSPSDLETKKFSAISLPARAPKGPYTEWGPLCSNNVHSQQIGTALGVSGDTIGAPVGAQVHFEFSTGADTGAVLLTEAPVEQDSFYHRHIFLDWCKKNQSHLIKYAPEVADTDLWIVTGVHTTPRCSLTVAVSNEKKVKVGFGLEAAVAGKLEFCKGWEIKTSDSGWIHAGNKPGTSIMTSNSGTSVTDSKYADDRVVVFISGLHFRFKPKAYLRKAHFNERQEKRGFLDTVLDLPTVPRATAIAGLTMATIGLVWISMYFRYAAVPKTAKLEPPSFLSTPAEDDAIPLGKLTPAAQILKRERSFSRERKELVALSADPGKAMSHRRDDSHELASSSPLRRRDGDRYAHMPPSSPILTPASATLNLSRMYGDAAMAQNMMNRPLNRARRYAYGGIIRGASLNAEAISPTEGLGGTKRRRLEREDEPVKRYSFRAGSSAGSPEDIITPKPGEHISTGNWDTLLSRGTRPISVHPGLADGSGSSAPIRDEEAFKTWGVWGNRPSSVSSSLQAVDGSYAATEDGGNAYAQGRKSHSAFPRAGFGHNSSIPPPLHPSHCGSPGYSNTDERSPRSGLPRLWPQSLRPVAPQTPITFAKASYDATQTWPDNEDIISSACETNKEKQKLESRDTGRHPKKRAGIFEPQSMPTPLLASNPISPAMVEDVGLRTSGSSQLRATADNPYFAAPRIGQDDPIAAPFVRWDGAKDAWTSTDEALPPQRENSARFADAGWNRSERRLSGPLSLPVLHPLPPAAYYGSEASFTPLQVAFPFNAGRGDGSGRTTPLGSVSDFGDDLDGEDEYDMFVEFIGDDVEGDHAVVDEVSEGKWAHGGDWRDMESFRKVEHDAGGLRSLMVDNTDVD